MGLEGSPMPLGLHPQPPHEIFSLHIERNNRIAGRLAPRYNLRTRGGCRCSPGGAV